MITLTKYMTTEVNMTSRDIIFDFFRINGKVNWVISDIERILSEHGHNGSSLGRTLRRISQEKGCPIVRISKGVYGWLR